jgi:hypothetical protein
VRKCTYIEACPFFAEEIGYSLQLNETMRARYCLGDSEACARYQAIALVGREAVPADLLPTEHERLAELEST